jgi:hypothetical protein
VLSIPTSVLDYRCDGLLTVIVSTASLRIDYAGQTSVREQSCRIEHGYRVMEGIRIGVLPAIQPEWVALDVPADCWVVIPEVVVVLRDLEPTGTSRVNVDQPSDDHAPLLEKAGIDIYRQSQSLR